MAVSIGKGRYYKLFAGNSPPKRLLIEDINEPGLLSDEYVQGLCNTASNIYKTYNCRSDHS